MTEISRPWGGTTIGDAGPYTHGDWTEVWQYLLGSIADADTGILSNVLNELLVTGVASPVTVNRGVALVNGTFYINDDTEGVLVPVPAGAQRIDRIVLRKDFAAQTVRIHRLVGIEGGGAPALTQDATYWDMPLFEATVAFPGGAITLVDQRERLNTRLPSMTTAERDAMTPINGMRIYNETLTQFQVYQNGAWSALVAADFQRVIVSGNWTKPTGVTNVLVVAIGAGGGGGGGEGQAVGNDRVAGAGGGGGAYAWKAFSAASLAAIEAVTIGAGGTSGAGGTGADGANGGNGGNTSFGSFLDAFGGGGGTGGGGAPHGGAGGGTASAAILNAAGLPRWDGAPSTGDTLAGSGARGPTAAGGGVAGYNAEYGGASGAASATTPVDGLAAGSSLYGAPGGGAGGGLPAANNERLGGAGGDGGSYVIGGGGAGGAAGGGAGGAGAAGADEKCGQGGGGGGGNNTGVGGVGGVGGAPGGGGGGGGGGTNTGGAGGVGGRGEVRVWSW